MELKRGIEKAVAAVVKHLEGQKEEVGNNFEKIRQVGRISANGDETIGNLIAEAMEKVGIEGVITVEEAKNMNDDAYVILQGYITDRNGDEKYVFQDKTGSITVEIDDDDWDGVDVSPADLVEIQGEIDKGWTAVEIDIDTISKVAPQMKNNAAAAK